MLLGVTGKKSKRKIWMQLRNKIELYKIRRVLKPIGCVSAQRREERLIISFNGNWLGYIEKERSICQTNYLEDNNKELP